MTEGTPTSMNNFFNSSHTAFAVKDFSRYTAGHLVHESTMHKQYLCPAADVGSIGPTTSIVICLKAVSFLGIEVISTLSSRMPSSASQQQKTTTLECKLLAVALLGRREAARQRRPAPAQDSLVGAF